MRILGIDPGFAIVGISIIDFDGNKAKDIWHGAITSDSSMNMDLRLKKIYDEISRVIDIYSPDDCAMEELFYFKNQKTVIDVAQARGVEILACLNKGLNIYEYTPLQIKQAVTGYGRADKRQMQQMVKMLLNLREVPKPDDVADAIAVAICHSSCINFKEEFLMR